MFLQTMLDTAECERKARVKQYEEQVHGYKIQICMEEKSKTLFVMRDTDIAD